MAINDLYITKSYKVKNLVSETSILLLREVLSQAGFVVHHITRGEMTLSFNPALLTEPVLEELLGRYKLGLLKDKDIQLVESIKIAVYELIHQLNNVNSIIQRSDYLVDKLGKSYQQLSRAFSKYESTTLEKYIINQKIERVKTLLDQDELSLSEIAYMMEYSSVQYLSSQFKHTTGISVSEYRQKP